MEKDGQKHICARAYANKTKAGFDCTADGTVATKNSSRSIGATSAAKILRVRSGIVIYLELPSSTPVARNASSASVS